MDFFIYNKTSALLITIDNMESSLVILFGNNSGKTIEKSSKQKCKVRHIIMQQ